MQTALMLEYQKSVGLHTRSHLHIPRRTTGSLDQVLPEATRSALTMIAARVGLSRTP